MNIEDRLIVELTRGGTVDHSLFSGKVDWGCLLRVCRANRCGGMIFDGLDVNGLLPRIPEEIRTGLEDDYLRDILAVRRNLEIAGRLAGRFASAAVPLAVLRGPALGLTVYPRPFLRPSSDLDLLVLKSDLVRAKKLLDEEGFGPAPGLLPDRYFERNHLHLTYLQPNNDLPVELHWALDHPYTLALVDYPALLEEKREVSFEGIPIPVLSPEDRVLTLSLHLVKHCPFLPELLEEKDFFHLLLRGRWLLWLLDLRRTILVSGAEINWATLAVKAQCWRLERETAAGLKAVAAVWGDFPGGESLRGLSFPSRGRLRRCLYHRQLEYLEMGVRSRLLTRRLFGLRTDTIFRPVRFLDLSSWIFPGSGWLRERYRVRGAGIIPAAIFQAVRAVRQILGNLMDYLYYRFRPW